MFTRTKIAERTARPAAAKARQNIQKSAQNKKTAKQDVDPGPEYEPDYKPPTEEETTELEVVDEEVDAEELEQQSTVQSDEEGEDAVDPERMPGGAGDTLDDPDERVLDPNNDADWDYPKQFTDDIYTACVILPYWKEMQEEDNMILFEFLTNFIGSRVEWKRE